MAPRCRMLLRAGVAGIKARGTVRTRHSAHAVQYTPGSVHMDKTLPQRLQKSVSGSFHKTALLQKRVRELIRGAAPLIETREQNPIKIAFLEMERGLIELIPEEEKPLL
ncbi:MAG: DNA-directed RNA polymerase subunit K/omega [Planctomycetota bacterium]|jgi:DNA-directed RNA polymerase subunit K/omega